MWKLRPIAGVNVPSYRPNDELGETCSGGVPAEVTVGFPEQAMFSGEGILYDDVRTNVGFGKGYALYEGDFVCTSANLSPNRTLLIDDSGNIKQI